MNQLMRQAKKMQEELTKAQEELAQRTIEGSAGGGAVKVKVSGQKEILGIEIDKEVVNPEEVEMLQDLIVAALQDALKQVDDMTSSELGKYTRGLNIPGLF
uniref:YbaB/EbfC family nucleoid-associated protein n=1 Tax=Alicyclobacillus tolerans TaxID=90970 RepID=UPI0023515F6B